MTMPSRQPENDYRDKLISDLQYQLHFAKKLNKLMPELARRISVRDKEIIRLKQIIQGVIDA